ncbi:MAG TPA: type II toxin-antitoxin system HicA family toxin [Tepidisphaeraceae bacterium]|nr:type II toxin-antitoxin system HicA family toxin [Tepidisphaeraceae bacterium]
MAAVPNVSGRRAVKAFERLGWTFVRQSGSHMILTKSGQMASLSVPDHNPVARGTLRSLIRAAGITVDEFVAALD